MDYVPKIDIMLKISKLGYYQSNINLYRYNPYSTLYNIVLWLKYYHHIFIWTEPRYTQGASFENVSFVYKVQPLSDIRKQNSGECFEEIDALEQAIIYALDLIEREKRD